MIAHARFIRRGDKRGTTLIFVLGILALMSLFAISFASVVRLERQASANYIMGVRAELAARAGVAEGTSFLHSMMVPQTAAGRYCETAFSNPFGPWHYHGYPKNDLSTGNGIPLRAALKSNRAVGSGTVPWSKSLSCEMTNPISANGITPERQSSLLASEKFSGILGGTAMMGGDTYALKILDCQGMININSQETTRLTALLTAVGPEIVNENSAIRTSMLAAGIASGDLDRYLPAISGNPFDSSKITDFIAARNALPNKMVRSKDQLRVLCKTGTSTRLWSDNDFMAIRDYVTCWSDYDETVVGSQTLTVPATTFGDTLTTPTAPTWTWNAAIDRYPVNINTAPRPVLLAVMSGVTCKKWTCVQDTTGVVSPGIAGAPSISPMKPYDSSSLTTVTCDATHAGTFADYIIAWRNTKASDDATKGRFRSWRDVYRCLMNGVTTPNADTDAAIAALVATCPYAFSMGWNPDRTAMLWDEAGSIPIVADKASATINTEFCFATNTYELESIGRVYELDANTTYHVESEATRRAVVTIGGFASFRGENDLKAWDDPANNGRQCWPQPLTSNAAPGGGGIPNCGWAQLAANDPNAGGYGLNPATALETGGRSPPDGFFQERTASPEVPIGFDVTAGDEHSDQGSISCWMKMPYDTSDGTNESLFTYVRRFADTQYYLHEPGWEGQDDPRGPSFVGCTTRLERYGHTLYAARFFWGKAVSPKTVDAACPPLGSGWDAPMFSYATATLPSWLPGTWHYVQLDWSKTDPSSLKITVDNTAAVLGTGTDKVADYSDHLHAHVTWDSGQVKYYGNTTDFSGALGIKFRMTLASMQPPGNTTPHMTVGGLDQSGNSMTLLEQNVSGSYSVGAAGSGNAIRWCNSTIADIQYNSTAGGVSATDRFPGFFKGTSFDLTSRIPQLVANDPNAAKLGCYVTWMALFGTNNSASDTWQVDGCTAFTSAAPTQQIGADANGASRWGGGVAVNSLTTVTLGDYTNLTSSAPDATNGVQTPFIFMGAQIQYLLPIPLYREESSQINEIF